MNLLGDHGARAHAVPVIRHENDKRIIRQSLCFKCFHDLPDLLIDNGSVMVVSSQIMSKIGLVPVRCLGLPAVGAAEIADTY